MSDNAKLRRCEDNLYVSGMGVIVLGIWSSVRPVIQIILGPSFNEIREIYAGYPLAVTVISLIIIIALLLLFLFLYMYVGLNAVRAAKRRKYKKGYFAVSIILLVLTAAGLITYKESLSNMNNIDTTIAALLVDVTGVYIFFTIISSSVKIKKLKKAQTEG